MRIAIVSWNRRRHGGAEEYIGRVVSLLTMAGHEVAFWHSVDVPASLDQIQLPDGVPIWSATELGEQEAIAALRAWSPEVIYAHGLENPNTEAEILTVAPAVFCAHNYYGTCITGSKMTNFPRAEPCGRRFGAKCLVNFYPRRCGGLNPATMWRDYRRQAERLSLLSQYCAIVTISRHMANEYINNGFDSGRVHHLPSPLGLEHRGNGSSGNRHMVLNGNQYSQDSAVRLTFLGRMHYSKGCSTLLAALPLIQKKLARTIHLTIAGDGPEREQLEKMAGRLNGNGRLRVEFRGWVSPKARDEMFSHSDLLVVPSLWPEPFGMVGLEACMHGLPVVAFDSGGVREWLHDGVNGYLATAHPPTSNSLAEAIVKSVENPETHERLRQGALQMASRFDSHTHVSALLRVFEQVVSESRN